ncbi:TetR/AcrR family transcriptional regulator C-terminal domain-containing protein [uncultured Brevibacterium sp.]
MLGEGEACDGSCGCDVEGVDAVAEQIRRTEASGDLSGDLLVLACDQLKLVMTPELVRLRRTVIAEAERFPELAEAFYQRGPGRPIAVRRELRILADRHEQGQIDFHLRPPLRTQRPELAGNGLDSAAISHREQRLNASAHPLEHQLQGEHQQLILGREDMTQGTDRRVGLCGNVAHRDPANTVPQQDPPGSIAQFLTATGMISQLRHATTVTVRSCHHNPK